jgi:CheY-like chemotaxis protein
LLPRSSYDIKEAATGVEGLTRLRDERPDIVLLDLNMPGMNGYEFLERLSAETNIPAIILTSMILDSEQRLRLGNASNIISKSDLSAPALTEAITTAMAKAEAGAA